MAVAFDAVGPSSSGASSTASPTTWAHVNAGNCIIVGVNWTTGGSSTITAVTYGGVSLARIAQIAGGGGTAGGFDVWGLISGTLPTGSNTVSVTGGGPGASNHVTGGSVSFTGAGSFGTPATANPSSGATASVSVTGTVSGGMIFGGASFGGGFSSWTVTSPGTQRWMVSGDTNGGADQTIGGTWVSPGGTQACAFNAAGGSDFWGLIAVEILPGGAAAGTGTPSWTAHRDRSRITDRRARYRRVQIQPAFGAPPPAAGIASLQGAGSIGGALAVQAAGATLVGAGSLSASTSTYIAGLGGSGAGYFIDNNGQPRMVLGDAAWALPGNAGRWNSGNWQADFDTYLSNRASQGFTVIYTKPIGTAQSGNIDSNGSTFDSLYPFQGGTPSTGVAGANPSTGLTSAFWARIDYFLNSALSKGITIFLNAIGYSSDFTGGPGPLAGKSTAEFTAYGTALGTRYASQPNLVWLLADDYFGTADSSITAFMTGVRGAGDTHAVSIENMAESDSRNTFDASPSVCSWGTSNGQFNACYSYNVTYVGIEKAYLESSPIPVFQLDGYFYQGTGGTYSATLDRAVRQDAWHALSSGARGYVFGDEAIWQWDSGSLTHSGSGSWFHQHNTANIRTLVESLPGWHTLVPDTSSALVTAGRGTHATTFSSGGGGGQYEPAFTDSYVTASRTPDTGSGSSLALIYMSHAGTITIDQTKMVSGYQAFWADPITGVMTSTTAGSTYNSTTQGNNSQGNPDWVLVLQAPTAITFQGTATLSGTGSVSTAATLGAGTALGGAGSLGTTARQGAGAALGGAGSLGNLDTTGAPATLGGTGLLSTAGTLSAIAALAGTGMLSTAAAQGAGAALSGTASLTAPAVQLPAALTLSGTASLGNLDITGAPATLGAAGSLTTAAVLGVTATLPGTGSLTAAATLSVTAALGGAGSVTTAAAQGAGAALSGTGSVTGNVGQGSSLSGQGSIGALATQGAGTVLGGAGSLSTAVTQLAPAALPGAGTLSTAVTQGAGAALPGAGSLSTAVTLAAIAALSGTGSLGTAATQGAGTTLAGTGSLTGSVGQGGQLSGQGSIGALATQGAGAALAAAGTLAETVTQLPAAAALAGAGSLGNLDTTGAPAGLGGTGTLTTGAVQLAPATLAAAGSLTTTAIQRAVAVLAGTGSLTAAGGPAGAASLNGAGSITGTGAVTGGAAATLTGTGTLVSLATLRAAAILAGAGTLVTGAVQQAGTALPAAGSLTAFGTQHPPQVKGFSTDTSVTRPMTSAASVGEAAGTAAAVTQPMQSAGSGVS